MPRLSKLGAAALAAFGWTSGVSAVSASYLVVAGGGAGGFTGNGGGGGAGGLLTGTTSLNPTLSYTVTVGAGGTSVAAVSSTNGGNSTFNAITATGGGAGGPNVSGGGAGNSGGSGGGGLNDSTNYAGGSGTSGQGNAGGASGGGGAPYPGGGGGGAGAAGTIGTSGGQGGAGTASSISGSSVTYAGGGGGARSSGGASAGGSGGGGNGGVASVGVAGTANTGGGGGGSGSGAGAQGGSGIVIISYAGIQKFGGGVVTSVGGNTIHTFTTSGTLSPLSSLSASYLVVAGGAGGGGSAYGGGGGAGGLLSGSSLTIDTNSNYVVTVGAGGAGGAGGAFGVNGSDSAFLSITSTGGGAGSFGDGAGGTRTGNSGGSGGGGGSFGSPANTGNGGAGTSGQGFAGGVGGTDAVSWRSGGGGGGSGSVGADRSTGNGGNGGSGTASSISGTSVTYAGGGGGAGNTSNGTATGGGGSAPSVAGTANLGGGGGGAGASGSGGAGGSGVVIISYAGSTQQMAGGTVTITGGNVIHTFTSSGYLTPIKYVSNSLRFRSSASASLTRTMSASGTTDTWSMWVKRGKLGTAQALFDYSNASTTSFGIEFTSGDALTLYSYSSGFVLNLITSAVYRDPAAWYHIVCVIDTTQATSTNRARIYVNGVQVTSFSTATYPAQNTSLNIANSVTYGIGVTGTANSQYFDGYMTEINFIDGQALTPNSFGTFNSYGVWQPITYGGSYGTNGFYLPFTNKTSTTTLGYDFSPNGNNWTPSAGISLTAGVTYDSMTDVPTLTSATAANYCVMNAVDSTLALTDGNLYAQETTAGTYGGCRATMAIPASGKWYWEHKVANNPSLSRLTVGLATSAADLNSALTGATTTASYDTRYTVNRAIYNQSTLIRNDAAIAFTTNDIVQCAYDADTGKLWFGKNNAWFDSSTGTTGNPSAGTNQTLTVSLTGFLFPFVSSYNEAGSGGAATYIDFGQQPFVYTPPTGFVALNTYNM